MSQRSGEGMDLAACPRCGSVDLRMPTVQDGLWPGGGETNFLVCAGCGYRGMPILFADVAALEAFRSSEREPEQDVAMPRARQVAMPVFIALVGVAAIGGAAMVAGANVAFSGATWNEWVAAAGIMFLGLAVGVSFLVIAWRAWRPTKMAESL